MTNVLKDKTRIILTILAIILVLFTWYNLKVKGITLTAEESSDLALLCENTDEDHVHTDECYGEAEETALVQDTTDVTETNVSIETTDTSQESEDDLSESIALENETSVVYEEDIAIAALDDVTESTDSQDVNVYINIDGTWTLIGTVSTTSSGNNWNSSYTLSTTSVTDLLSSVLGIDLDLSSYTLYYGAYSNSSFSTNLTKLSLSNSSYTIGTSSAINLYITNYSSSSNNNGPGNNSTTTLTTVTSGNTLQVTSFTIYEYDIDGTTLANTITAYSISSELEYTLSTEYNYYIDGSTDLTSGGSTITITNSTTTLVRVEVEKCTVTIIYIDGTVSSVEVNSGQSYTLPQTSTKWIVDSEEYSSESSITITDDITIRESSEITVTFTVDLDSAETVLGLEVEIPTYITENNELTYTVTVSYDSGITTVSLTSDYVISIVSNTYRYIAQFTNWVEKTTNTIYNTEEEIDWNTLYSYAVDGKVYFNTSWTKEDDNTNYVNFYIQLYGQAVDNGSDVTGRLTENYTTSLWSSYVGSSTGNIDTDFYITDSTSDNSYSADASIRALEGTEGDIYIYDVPDDDFIFSQLKDLDETLYADDGTEVDKDELDSDHFVIRWYVFKSQNDCWHVDGKLVRREGKATITKTFTGSKSAIESVTGYSFDSGTQGTSSYYITVKGSATTTLYLTDWTSSNSTTEAYFINETTTVDGSTTYSITYTWIVDTKMRHRI